MRSVGNRVIQKTERFKALEISLVYFRRDRVDRLGSLAVSSSPGQQQVISASCSATTLVQQSVLGYDVEGLGVNRLLHLQLGDPLAGRTW